jgi:hypothetical protein
MYRICRNFEILDLISRISGTIKIKEDTAVLCYSQLLTGLHL